MSKIIAGVVVPVVVAIIGALLLLCKKKKKNTGPEAGDANANNPVQSNQTAATNNIVAPQMAQNTQGQSNFAPAAPGYAAPVYVGKQEAVHGVHDLGPSVNTQQPGIVSPEISKEQQVTTLEQEQARIQAEIQRLRNTGS